MANSNRILEKVEELKNREKELSEKQAVLKENDVLMQTRTHAHNDRQFQFDLDIRKFEIIKNDPLGYEQSDAWKSYLIDQSTFNQDLAKHAKHIGQLDFNNFKQRNDEQVRRITDKDEKFSIPWLKSRIKELSKDDTVRKIKERAAKNSDYIG